MTCPACERDACDCVRTKAEAPLYKIKLPLREIDFGNEHFSGVIVENPGTDRLDVRVQFRAYAATSVDPMGLDHPALTDALMLAARSCVRQLQEGIRKSLDEIDP